MGKNWCCKNPTISILAVVGSAFLCTLGETCVAADAPIVVGRCEYNTGDSFLATMPDGSINLFFPRNTGSGWEVARRATTDNGYTWSDPQGIYTVNPKDFTDCTMPLINNLPLVTQDGGLHMFWMAWRGSNLDIWTAHSDRSLTTWNKPLRLLRGYCGALMGVTQLANGRIVLPYSYLVPGRSQAPPTGAAVVTTRCSDDGGDTWLPSTAAVTTPCSPNYNGSNYGASEPTVVQLNDGRVWMIIRTQTGRLYESYSTDGQNWSDATPTTFYSSDSPGVPLRMRDGRLVLFWNNCENTSRIDGAGVYTNRDAIHAAISSDEGKTWRGFREVFLDPLRNEPPPSGADIGAAYPMPAATADGKILLATGQGEGRRSFVLIDPDWLEETSAADDFSHGLDGWSVYKPYGPPDKWFRPRVQGPQLEDHPTEAGAKVLHVRRPDEKPGDEAIWNFPAGRQGKVEMRLLLKPGHQDLCIALADRYIQPSDSNGALEELFRLPINADGSLPGGGATLLAGQWHTLELAWNLDKDDCQILVDGKPAGSLAQYNDEPDSPGISYLRFRSTAGSVDTAGMLIDWVQVSVVPEPSTLALLAAGLIGLLAYAWRKRR